MAMMSHDFLYERPQTGESIHCTSIASDLTETRDSELKSEIDQTDGSGLVDTGQLRFSVCLGQFHHMSLACEF